MEKAVYEPVHGLHRGPSSDFLLFIKHPKNEPTKSRSGIINYFSNRFRFGFRHGADSSGTGSRVA